MKRETKYTETERNKIYQNETKRNEMKQNGMEWNQMKRNLLKQNDNHAEGLLQKGAMCMYLI